MSASYHYDTVAFDERHDATVLFFGRTTETGDIADYLLIMRTGDTAVSDPLFLEANERRIAEGGSVREATMSRTMLNLVFDGPVEELGGSRELTLVFDDSAENRLSITEGAFRLLGDRMTGGHA